MVQEMTNAGLSLRKALDYAGCSNNLYYHRQKPVDIPLDQKILEKTKEIAVQRPTYGTRRVGGSHAHQGAWCAC